MKKIGLNYWLAWFTKFMIYIFAISSIKNVHILQKNEHTKLVKQRNKHIGFMETSYHSSTFFKCIGERSYS